MTAPTAVDAPPGSPTTPTRRGRRSTGAGLVVAAAVVLSLLRAGDPLAQLNGRGWAQVGDFLLAAVRPETDGTFLALVWREALVTLAYAALGTALAVAIGAAGALVLTRRWWQRPGPGHDRTGPGWLVARGLAVLPRSIHEVVWGLLLLNVLGLDPLVAVLAIGIPFGTITAKVFADVVDDADGAAFAALRAAGAGRLAALAYSIAPTARADLVSYGFYRFECAIRAAAILGIVGAGGLGFQLQLSFTSLRYEEVWTLLWALVALNGAADAWSGWVRRRAPSALAADGRSLRRTGTRSSATATAIVLVPGIPLAWWWVDLDPTTLWSARARDQLQFIAAELWPPALRDGWATLVGQCLDTLALSVLAMAVAFVGAVAVAVVASGAVGPRGVPGLALRTGCRAVLLLARAIPPPVWAIVVLFVLLPGPWPGAIALGLYNLGVLGRLLSEVVEDADDGAALALVGAGASRLDAAAYATLPTVFGRFVSLALYRWEVTIRETVVVGVVGAGGLGRALDDELSSFAWSKVTGILLALVAITFAVDLASARLRRAVR